MDLSARLVQALQPLILRSRTRITPAQLRELAERLAADYGAALQANDGHDPAPLAREWAERGLHPDLVFAAVDVLYAAGCARDPEAREITGGYLRRFLGAFTAHRERLIKQELEASLQARKRLEEQA